MASDPDISSISPNVCVFWDAPLEVREMVYEMVHGGPRQFKFLSKASWKKRENKREDLERARFVPAEFPESPLAHLLIGNKQYFEEALRMWMRGTTFVSAWACEYMEAWQSSTAVNKFILEHISSLVLEGPYFDFLREPMPHLLDLTIRISSDEYELKQAKHKVPWLHAYTDVELSTIGAIERLLHLRGLRSFTLERELCGWRAKELEQQKRWEALQNQTENLIRDVVTQPREPRGGARAPARPNFRKALELTMDKNKSTTSKIAAQAPQSIPAPPPLCDKEVPESEDALLRFFLTKPKAMKEWIKDVKVRAATQGSTSVQQRDESALSEGLPKPQPSKSNRVRGPKSKTDIKSSVPSSRMPSSPDWHFTKHVDSETLEEVVHCTEHTKPKKRRAR